MTSDPDSSEEKRLPRITAVTAVVVLSLILVVTAGRAGFGPKRSPEFLDAVAETDGWADESACADCHDQAAAFSETGHARTLKPASAPESVQLLDRLKAAIDDSPEQIRIVSRDGQPTAVRQFGDVEQSLCLNWCFGSGTHASTWVSTIPDSHGNTDVLEFRQTWFPAADEFGVTPGQPDIAGVGSVSAFGLLFDGPKARRCFSCHSTAVPFHDGKIDESGIRPGVTCQRCHGPRARHVATEGDYHPVGWQNFDRDESVRRCAVCHRLSEERDPHEIVAGNPDIVRFQPMGLMESACYKNSQIRCTTCHDPHLPMDQQPLSGIQQCVQCHDPQNSAHVLCAAGHRDNCLSCHMPKVRMEFPIDFTDHWIRVPDRAEQ